MLTSINLREWSIFEGRRANPHFIHMRTRINPATGFVELPETSHTILNFGRHMYAFGHAESNAESPVMMDAIVAIGDFAGSGSNYYAIFDGHGGKDVCEYAGNNVHRIFSRDFTNDVSPSTLIKPAIDEVQEYVKKTWPDQGCSAAILCVFQNQAIYTANLGDTRIMIISPDGELLHLSEVHDNSNELEVQTVTLRGATLNNGKIMGQTSLTRSIGDGAIDKYISHEPFCQSMKRVDRMVAVIACAGVWEVLPEKRVAQLAVSHTTAMAAANAITNEAVKKGATANVSCIVVWLTPK